MIIIHFFILFLFGISYGKVINLTVAPSNKAQKINFPSVSGYEENQFILTTNPDHKIRIFCRLKVKDCLVASITIDDGKEEIDYCGRRGAQILASSRKNVLKLTLSTKQNNIAECAANAVKSFVNFEVPERDSSEDGVAMGTKSTSCRCGWANKAKQRIVNGRETKINEFPFAAVIVRLDLKIAFCGGSVISRYHVLTAAHCFISIGNAPLVVAVGEHDLGSATETNATQKIHVNQYINHPEFDQKKKVNDISVVFLKQKIEFNQFVGPICLSPERIPLEDKFVTVMGWGRLYDHGPQSRVLRKTTLKIIDFPSCMEFYSLKRDDRNQFCTFNHDTDSCQGDSGGPVVWLDPETNRFTQLGVVSYGRGCAHEDDIPGVNTDVSYFKEWIESTIIVTEPSASTCHKTN